MSTSGYACLLSSLAMWSMSGPRCSAATSGGDPMSNEDLAGKSLARKAIREETRARYHALEELLECAASWDVIRAIEAARDAERELLQVQEWRDANMTLT